ncbi:MAG TPA: carboxypeptidase-like regulatory domain-containing protein, partial [Terriglobia bacterium]|nr:carboxypeptidase-like regulatory domain-containing protein [Terriglobia bacterium]
MVRKYVVKKYGLLAAFIAICLSAGTGIAQVKSSAITGIVTDASGALVPNATVAVTNEQTNVAFQSKSNGAGEYTVPYLEAGRYSVTVTEAGFQTYRKTGIILETASTVRVDVALVTGTLTTTVEVKANVAALQTENAAVQEAVSTNIIDAIPNINKNPLYYASLEAGVVPDFQSTVSSTLGVGFSDRRDLSAIRINGAELGTDDVQLDGVTVQGSGWHEMTVMPDPDALQEVRVTTNNFTAETGDAQGVIAMTTKSGTNQFHGDLNYYLRNEALNANGLTNNMMGIPKPVYRLNQGAGSIGGPVIIPHLYNGKDKMFFFVDFLRLAHSAPDTVLLTVPTDLQRQGNFSATMVSGISGTPVNVNLYNPFLATPLAGSGGTVVQRPIYPGAIITNPNQYGLKLLAAYPEPNNPPTDPFGDNNYLFKGTNPEYRNALVARLDSKLSQKNFLYGTGGISFGSITQPNQWGPTNPFISMNWGGDTKDKNPYVSIGDTYTASPTMVSGISGTPVNVNLYNPFLATPLAGSGGTVVQRPIYPGAIITN